MLICFNFFWLMFFSPFPNKYVFFKRKSSMSNFFTHIFKITRLKILRYIYYFLIKNLIYFFKFRTKSKSGVYKLKLKEYSI